MNPRRPCAKHYALWVGTERYLKAGAIVHDAQITDSATAGNETLLDGDFNKAQGQAHSVTLLLYPLEWRIGREILQIKVKSALQCTTTKNKNLSQPHLG